jgi:tight adherence protein C
MLILGLALIFAAIVIGLVTVLGQADERATIRASLRQLDGYEVSNVRDQELLKPVTERAVAPVFQGLLALGKRLTPLGSIERIRGQFLSLGHAGSKSYERFMAARTMAQILVLPWVFFVLGVMKMEGMLGLALAGVGGFLLFKGLDVLLTRRV